NVADSSQVATHDLAADVQIVADGSGTTTVYVNLWNPPPGDTSLFDRSVRLVEDDRLVASAQGKSAALTEYDVVVAYTYEASFPFDDDGARFTVALDRSTDVSAPNSTASLPAAFAVSAPGSFSRATPLTVTWSRAARAIAWPFSSTVARPPCSKICPT